MTRVIPSWAFPLLFFFSGFTALIFEATWSQYLKLFLGHSAYAQSVVLVLFMGGMAIGAWLSSKISDKSANLLRTYAFIEGVIGILGITFHSFFTYSLDFSFNFAIPSLQSELIIEVYKWAVSACLILPQTILLGMTFPYMANAAIRRHPDTSGQLVGILYFSNSAGAALGALITAFVLIKAIGLPGSVLFAGIINVLIAVVAYFLSSSPEPRASDIHDPHASRSIKNAGIIVLLFCSAITGAASFIYEVTWIRMLSMIIGSAFHSFEIMLSAFITGLAIGGLWIKIRIKHIQDKVQYLAFVQIVMGLLAIVSLYLYNHAFETMSFILKALHRNYEGYFFYNISSHGISFLIMLPATILAGMTLPLVTSILIDKGNGEKSIGQVYAANTLGAIVGVLFTVHIGFGLLGIKGLMISGGLLDISIGWILLRTTRSDRISKIKSYAVASLLLLASIYISYISWPNYAYMASSVYRTGVLDHPDKKIIFHADGKTSSISLTRSANDVQIISTNGKPDAAINMNPARSPHPDEYTMTMLGLIPLTLKPDAQHIANIGFGSGLTSDVLLGSPYVKRLDTIEIEKMMPAGARMFYPRVSRVFDDNRSHIIFDDARTFFSRNRKKYDIIISEPSNPWVSGVASLFTTEFYRDVKRHLNNDGLFVQWIHEYELNDRLMSSVINAFSPHFEDYAVYRGGILDLIFIMSKNGPVPDLSDKLLQSKSINESLNSINIRGMEDIYPLYIAGRKTINTLSRMASSSVNSDYFPILQTHAPKNMYLKTRSTMMHNIEASPVPIKLFLDRNAQKLDGIPENLDISAAHKKRFDAINVANILSNEDPGMSPADSFIKNRLDNLKSILLSCQATSHESSINDLLWFSKEILPYVEYSEIENALTASSSCTKPLRDPDITMLVELVRSIAQKDISQVIKYSAQYLQRQPDNIRLGQYLVSIAMLAYKASGSRDSTNHVWESYGKRYFKKDIPFYIKFIMSH